MKYVLATLSLGLASAAIVAWTTNATASTAASSLQEAPHPMALPERVSEPRKLPVASEFLRVAERPPLRLGPPPRMGAAPPTAPRPRDSSRSGRRSPDEIWASQNAVAYAPTVAEVPANETPPEEPEPEDEPESSGAVADVSSESPEDPSPAASPEGPSPATPAVPTAAEVEESGPQTRLQLAFNGSTLDSASASALASFASAHTQQPGAPLRRIGVRVVVESRLVSDAGSIATQRRARVHRHLRRNGVWSSQLVDLGWSLGETSHTEVSLLP
ncbi:MAG: hypothetical protein AAGE52_03260 [Myxococcota bacterium]